MRALLRDSRGAIMVEYLIAFLPTMFLFTSIWQLAELYAAQLIVQRAASAAGRAASVVLADDPFYYPKGALHKYEDDRRKQVEQAAHLVLEASGRILASPLVEVDEPKGNGPFTTRVRARFLCFTGWGVLVCGPDGERELTASARYPYHRAGYKYP